MRRILISSCLLGQKVRYDGGDKLITHPMLEKWQDERRLVPICPEMAGGLPAPRAPAEIEPGASAEDVLAGNARVMNNQGRDDTDAFVNGAKKALAMAKATDCHYALLTDRSPSCGATIVYSGRFDSARQPGQGVMAALLLQHGIEIYAQDNIEDLAQKIDQLGR